MIRAARFATLLAAALAVTADARAETRIGPWDAARDPAAESTWELHAHVRELLLLSEMPIPTLLPHSPALQTARILLEKGDARHSPDVRLRFNLAEVYSRLRVDSQLVIDVLEPAIRMAPDSPVAMNAYATLAEAYAQLDRSSDERRVYESYVPRITRDDIRCNALLNLAEADMHLADLPTAIDHYREALDIAAGVPNIVKLHGTSTETLAAWGLAVALDQSGDVGGAAKETRLALELDERMQTIGHGEHVFFAPARERYWYIALGFAEYAKEARDAEPSAQLWWRAEGCWREYVEDVAAHASANLWVDIARARLEKVHAMRSAAERRANKRVVFEPHRCVD